MKNSTIQKSIHGFFVLDLRAKKVVQNYGHDFSYSLCRNLDHAFAEDKGLEKAWNQNKLSGNENIEFLNIIREASEYYVLKKLSTHIDAEFDDSVSNADKTRIYNRGDIPTLLATNRFLDLFSEPISLRAIFSSGAKSDEICRCENGAMFRHFGLQLPKHSKIERDSNHSFTIRNKWFTLNINTIFEGHMTALPIDFCEVYLGLQKVARYYPTLGVNFEVKAKFRFGAMLSRTGKQYNSILQTFVTDLEKAIDMDYYFDKQLQWEQTRVILEILERRNAKDRVK